MKQFTLSGDGTTGGTYGYDMDEFGNITGQTATSGDPKLPAGVVMSVNPATNRLNSIGAGPNLTTITYDVLGNQVTQIGPEGQRLTLDYLDQGHIRKVIDPDTNAVLYRYYYDADGKRRIKAQADSSGVTSITDNCSYAFYEGEDLVCQQDRGALIVEDPDDPGEPDADYYGTKFLLLDHLGSTRAELVFTDVAGTIVPTLAQTYDLMPYGERIETIGENPSESTIFTGKTRDPEIGHDVFGPRFYLGSQMRWGSVDSIQFERKMPNPQDWNGYSYANRNPIRNIDPNGRDFLDMIKKCANYVSKGDYKKAVREVQRHLDIKAGWGATIGGLGVAEKNIGRREYSLPGLALGDKPKISVGYSAAVGYQATFETKDETRYVKELRENVIGQREVVTVGSYTEKVPDNDKPMQEEMNFGPFTQNVSTGELTLSFSLSMFGYAEIELNLTNLLLPEIYQIQESVDFDEYRDLWNALGSDDLKWEPARAN